MIASALRMMGGFDNTPTMNPFQAATGMQRPVSPNMLRGQTLLNSKLRQQQPGAGGAGNFGTFRMPGFEVARPQWNAPMASSYMKEYSNPIQGMGNPFFHFF